VGWKIVEPVEDGREPDSKFFELKSHAEENWNRWWGLTDDEIQEVLKQRLLNGDYSRSLSLAERGPALAREAKKRISADNHPQDNPSMVHNPPSGWPENRDRPAPQQYGASWRGAEFLVADWLLFLGEREVEVTNPAVDDGLDVLTKSYCCQVKNYASKPIGVVLVRELLGVATSVARRPLLFTSTRLTATAFNFAESNGIAVVLFNTTSGELSPLTSLGQLLLSEGRY
jgi:hypothetical protein